MKKPDKPAVVPPRGVPFSPSAVSVRWHALSPEGLPARGYDRIPMKTQEAVNFVAAHLERCGYTQIVVTAFEGHDNSTKRKRAGQRRTRS